MRRLRTGAPVSIPLVPSISGAFPHAFTRQGHAGRERLESNAWNDEDAVAYWWLVKSNGSTVTVTERDEVLRGALVPGTMQNWS